MPARNLYECQQIVVPHQHDQRVAANRAEVKAEHSAHWDFMRAKLPSPADQ